MQINWQTYWEIKLTDFYIAIPFILLIAVVWIIYSVFSDDE